MPNKRHNFYTCSLLPMNELNGALQHFCNIARPWCQTAVVAPVDIWAIILLRDAQQGIRNLVSNIAEYLPLFFQRMTSLAAPTKPLDFFSSFFWKINTQTILICWTQNDQINHSKKSFNDREIKQCYFCSTRRTPCLEWGHLLEGSEALPSCIWKEIVNWMQCAVQ